MIKSKTILPAEKRETATTKELLKALDACELQLEDILQSPILSAYKAITKKINDWSDELSDGTLSILNDDTDFAFERSHKFFKELSFYIDSRDKLLKQMTPDEKELVGDAVTRHSVNPREKQ